MVDARKTRYGKDDLAELFAEAKRIVVAKGKKTLSFDPGTDDPDDITKAVLGPSGNLRAPTVRCGNTWLVGFNDDLYEDSFG